MARLRKSFLAFATITTLFAASCDATGPGFDTELFRLHSINGQLLPYVTPPSTGFVEAITHGDLLLRNDGTFVWGLAANFGGTSTGIYQRSRGGFTLNHPAQNSVSVNGAFRADSAIIDIPGSSSSGDVPALPSASPPRRYVFVRAAPNPGAVGSGTYALAALGSASSISGGFVVFDTVVGSTRYVTRVADTITFTDAVFFSRAFVSHDTSYFQGIPVAAAGSYLLSGSYTGGAAYLVLRRYMAASAVNMAARDSLVIDGDGKLIRINAIPRAVYTRVR